MLNAETKKIINSARDVLVGKIPDPKAQVEQITFAMFYKFMDEKDNEAVALGGKRQFFTGEFENFSWSKLMDQRLGGTERMDLYTQALAKMSQNPHIAQLFRDIYKDAFIPFRSPETLSLFLKEIDQLDYTNTESLGDAFEYLLSVMGSQGDAGQFRTPRHIIDFMVDVVDPQKSDTILDPACGTAGFLISSYKHIVKQHDGKDDPENKETPLTPDEKKDLMRNLMGYDISPDMVRLSKVNLYLHGLSNPTIYEYDTLSSEEKWDENFDVILANPPFMSPKGGIKPHKRFSIQANRAEVLFVDYIIEHLKPNGRAGIIVPEGIIFQSSNAYKELRKKLVEVGLFAVVSLPSGVFQPYSGVKTSILFFDKDLSKRSDSILFVKVENDGYGLGSQRSEINKNDLPLALTIINSYKKNILNNNTPKTNDLEELSKNTISIFVPKSKIRELGDYYLTGDRYKEINEITNQKWPTEELGQIVKMVRGPFGGSLKKEIFKPNGYLVYEQYHAINKDFDFGRYFIDENKFNEMKRFEVNTDDILISCSGTMGKIAIIPNNHKKGIINQALLKLTSNKVKILPKFLSFILESDQIQKKYFRNQSGVAIQNVMSVKILSHMVIPVPPINFQIEVIDEIENYQKIIDGAKQVVGNWRPKINIDSGWVKVKLSKVCEKITDGSHNPPKEKTGGGYFMLSSQNVFNGYITTDKAREITEEDFKKEDRRTSIKNDDVLLTIVGTIGRTAVVTNDLPYRITLQRSVAVLKPKTELIIPEFLNFVLRTDELRSELITKSAGVAQKGIYLKQLSEILIPLPPLENQKQIVEKIENEHLLVESNKKLIQIYEEKIKNVISNI